MAGQRTCATRSCQFADHSLHRVFRQQIEAQRSRPAGFDGVAQDRGQRIDQAAFEPGCGKHELAAAAMFGAIQVDHCGNHGLDRLTRETLAKMRAPAHVKAAVCRPKWRQRHPGRMQDVEPTPIRPQPCPAGAAQGEHHRVGFALLPPIRRRVAQPVTLAARVRPTTPAATHVKAHPSCSQPLQPGAQQWSSLHAGREDASGTADKRADAEAVCPFAQLRRPEGIEQRSEFSFTLTIPSPECCGGLGVGEVQSAPAGQQQLAAD